jgi:hypothetical protein
MTENEENRTNLKDPVDDTLDFRKAVESLIAARPDLADPDRLRLFEQALHRQIAMRSSTAECVQTEAVDAIAAAEMERSRKFMSFAINVSGGGAAAILTSIAVPGAPAFVIVAMGLLGLVATKLGAPRLNRWADKRQRGHRRSPA